MESGRNDPLVLKILGGFPRKVFLGLVGPDPGGGTAGQVGGVTGMVGGGLDRVGGYSGFEVEEGLDMGGKAVFWGGIGAHSDFAEEASGLGDEEGFNPEVILK